MNTSVATRVLFLAFALTLCGCASTPAFSGYAMTLDSDACREASILRDNAPGAKTRTAGERQAAFDQAHHACMVAKGY